MLNADITTFTPSRSFKARRVRSRRRRAIIANVAELLEDLRQQTKAARIPPEKRLAIYARDGFQCLFCGAAIEDGAEFTLDHLVCQCDGGSHKSSNLITACLRCNNTRGERDWREFAKGVAAFLGADPRQIKDEIEESRRQPLDIEACRNLLMVPGSYAAALARLQAEEVNG